MLRSLLAGAFTVAILASSIPSSACAGTAPFLNDYPNCPSYELATIGDEGTGLQVDSFGRFVLGINTLDDEAGDLGVGYFVWDEPSLYGVGSYLFAWTQYDESNGIPWLQRDDDLCNNTPPGAEPDDLLFIC